MRRDRSSVEFDEVCTLCPADLALVASLLHAGKGHDLRLIQDDLGHRARRHTLHYARTAGRFQGLWGR
jgi:hypothetical protein